MLPDIKQVSWPGWETVRLIGRGSFGAVYEIQRDVLGDVEKAALKVISIPQNESEIDDLYRDGYDEDSIVSTFQSHLKNIVNEYSLMRKMNGCSNIVHCDDVRYVPKEGTIGWDIYIKMELLTPLGDALPQEIPEETVIKAAKDMCRALEICSMHDVIHRDIKPQNMFYSHNGDFKLGDFGIAKTVERTMGGTKIGTFKYMAPEVYHNQPYGAAADIYSLGLVLYWMLNDRRTPFVPLPPAKLLAGTEGEASNRRLMGETIPAPKNGSSELQRIVLKACAYNPKDRYSSATEMLRDLESLERPAVTATPVAVPEKPADIEKTIRVRQARSSSQQNVSEPDSTVRVRKAPEAEQHSNKRITPADSGVITDPDPSRKKNQTWILVIAIIGILVAIAVIIITVVHFLGQGKSIEDSPQESQSQMHTNADENSGQSGDGTEQICFSKDSVFSIGDEHIVALKADGTVVATGDNGYGQCDVSGWSDIIAVQAGRRHTVGLKADGTVVAVGWNDDLQCDVSHWTDVISVYANERQTWGIKKDGTVLCTNVWTTPGEKGWPEEWTDIAAISTKSSFFSESVGLKKDGTMVSLCFSSETKLETSQWTNIVSACIGQGFDDSKPTEYIIGLKADGTVISSGDNVFGQCNVSDWTNIVSVNTSGYHTVGLKNNGTVVATGSNNFGQCNVETWSNIVSICVGTLHTVGLKADGTVVAIGQNEYGQCEVTDWNDIIAIYTSDTETFGLKKDGTVVTTNTWYDVSDWKDICTDIQLTGTLNDGNNIIDSSQAQPTEPDSTFPQQAEPKPTEPELPTVQLTHSSITFSFEGEQYSLFAGGDVTADKLTWVSSNTDVATVNSFGTIYAVGEGTVYIYAKYNGTTLASCRITCSFDDSEDDAESSADYYFGTVYGKLQPEGVDTYGTSLAVGDKIQFGLIDKTDRSKNIYFKWERTNLDDPDQSVIVSADKMTIERVSAPDVAGSYCMFKATYDGKEYYLKIRYFG